MLTAGTITDAQIATLRRDGERMLSDAVRDGTDRSVAFDVLLVTHNALMRNTDTSDGNGTHDHWRGRCADILNLLGAVA